MLSIGGRLRQSFAEHCSASAYDLPYESLEPLRQRPSQLRGSVAIPARWRVFSIIGNFEVIPLER
jgi:hypothetical protein